MTKQLARKPSALLRRAATHLKQSPEALMNQAKAAYAMLLLDTSSSMDGVNMNQAKSGAKGWATLSLEKGYQVGLVTFSGSAVERIAPTEDLNQLRTAIDSMEASGSTNMSEAIDVAVSRLKELKGLRKITLVTDGMPNDEGAAIASAAKAKQLGIDIETRGVDEANIDLLRRLATDPSNVEVVTKDQLEVSMQNAAKLLPSPENPTGGRRLLE